VTSVITNQITKLKLRETEKIIIGNVNTFRDWSHVKDITTGYLKIADKGKSGEVYNQGSMRTTSVLSYILLGLEEAGWEINKIKTLNGEKMCNNPTEKDNNPIYGINFEKTKIDRMILEDELDYNLEDKGIKINTNKNDILIQFDPKRFRPAEVPILLANTEKLQHLGAESKHHINDIIKDQLNYFIKNR
jgi:GDPmannose 4,6-dehydratase